MPFASMFCRILSGGGKETGINCSIFSALRNLHVHLQSKVSQLFSEILSNGANAVYCRRG